MVNPTDPLREGPLPRQEALSTTFQLFVALEVVHAKLGLVHRDIQPSNVLFTADGRAKLADFDLYVSRDEREFGELMNDDLLDALAYYVIVDARDPSNVYAAIPYGISKLEA